MMQPYSPDMYAFNSESSTRSAARVVPLIIELLHPRSIADVGCGTGTWLKAFMDRGVTDVQGFDSESVPGAQLQIPVERFTRTDLTQPFTAPRRFDLAISLEVAEHLPESSAAGFVGCLTQLADVVVFSAAIPGQGGYRHINEQWPEYWADIFARTGHEPIDAIRPLVRNDGDVSPWYAENILVFARPEIIAANPTLAAARRATTPGNLTTIHPAIYRDAIRRLSDPREISIKVTARLLLDAIKIRIAR